LFIGEWKPPPDTFKSGSLTLKYKVIDVKKEIPELYKESFLISTCIGIGFKPLILPPYPTYKEKFFLYQPVLA
jgi:hypothetical protein